MKPNFKNRTLFTRDNLHIMQGMNSECVDLIYIDPPFNSNVIYQGLGGKMGSKHDEKVEVFKDIWKLTKEDEVLHESIKEEHRCIYEVIEASQFSFGKNMKSYLINMTVRLMELHRILKATGSVYLHCDPTASHYLKIILDCIFGAKNFRNEIVWCYKSGGASKKQWAKKHDIILFYSKSDEWTFNEQKEKSYMGIGYNTGNKNVTLYKDEHFEARGHYTLVNGKDWWTIGMLATSSKERTGYPTQKPLKLLREDIIRQAVTRAMLCLTRFAVVPPRLLLLRN